MAIVVVVIVKMFPDTLSYEQECTSLMEISCEQTR